MYKTLKIIRIVLAALVLFCITALILDFTEGAVLRHWLGWMPKIQLLPAILALNVVVVLAVLLVTFLIGRLYCSVVCPMGIFQDIFIWFHKIIFGKKRPYRYRKPQNWVRYTVLALFVILMVLGLNGIATLVAPYSAYARMVANIHGTGLVHWIAIATLCCVGVMSFLYGRLWCNTLCPVGTLLGLISKYSLFGIRIEREKCVACGKCEKRCKANCINLEDKSIDGSRCVMCFNCLGHCKQGAIKIDRKGVKAIKDPNALNDPSRRKFLAVTATVGAATALQAQEKKLDGGLAAIENKQVPQRNISLKPAGAISLKNFESRCTACQLCVGKCPEKVLRPSTQLTSLMQPYMAFDEGYCRTACTRCSEVCPTGAIQHIDKEQKTAISIGHAVVLMENCIGCGACARHCPSTAILMVEGKPAVNESKCLGCGACEYYCPARPMTAIYVEGRERHVEM
ncbi:MAG: 4Fe-4S binding protein [Bacteroidales bacterium]|nr:4Fe-4S binding protein [Bacteroidales bacterium]